MSSPDGFRSGALVVFPASRPGGARRPRRESVWPGGEVGFAGVVHSKIQYMNMTAQLITVAMSCSLVLKKHNPRWNNLLLARIDVQVGSYGYGYGRIPHLEYSEYSHLASKSVGHESWHQQRSFFQTSLQLFGTSIYAPSGLMVTMLFPKDAVTTIAGFQSFRLKHTKHRPAS